MGSLILKYTNLSLGRLIKERKIEPSTSNIRTAQSSNGAAAPTDGGLEAKRNDHLRGSILSKGDLNCGYLRGLSSR